MKKILFICFVLSLVAFAAPAQRNVGSAWIRADRTRLERIQLQRDLLRYRLIQRNAERDGMLTFLEEKRLNCMKRKNRREALRFGSNGRKSRLY